MEPRSVLYRKKVTDMWAQGSNGMLVGFATFQNEAGNGHVEGIVIDDESREYSSVPIFLIRDGWNTK